MTKPRVFVGSASETRGIVDALESELRDVAIIERWDVDVFRSGHFTLEELTRAVHQVDFAIFVLGGDDVTESRGSTSPSPRDNVIFEAGLFTAVLGPQRTFYVVNKAGTKIPSDWAGLGYTTFDNAEVRPRDKVYDAVRTIREQITAWQPLRSLGACRHDRRSVVAVCG
jgi:predicted nucleotide-binding protein